MSVPTSFTNGGGSATVTPSGSQFGSPPFSSIPVGVPLPSSFFGSPPAPTVITTLTIVPTIQETTIITLVTSTGTSITTITTLSTNTNIVSTTTETYFSITALPNPAATAGLTQASSLLTSNASLTRTNTIVSLVFGILSFLLLILIAILFFLYLRRRRKAVKRTTDDESPPFTSLAPRPAPFPIITPDRPLRQSMQETSLSMGPRGGTVDSYERAVREAQARTSDALNSHPLTRPSRSFSAPINGPALESTTRIPRFDAGLPSINIMSNTPASSRRARTAEGRDERSPSPITPPLNVSQPPLRRNQPTLQRVPMYQAELQEQAQRQRQSAMAATAGRLELPVVAGIRRGSAEERASGETEGSDVSGYEDGGGGSRERNEMGITKGMASRTPIPHSTRASSGVFPEGDRERDSEEEEESEKMVAGGGRNDGNGGGNEDDDKEKDKGKEKEKEKDES